MGDLGNHRTRNPSFFIGCVDPSTFTVDPGTLLPTICSTALLVADMEEGEDTTSDENDSD